MEKIYPICYQGLKKNLYKVILLSFCLFTIQVNAKTIHYVKNGATGDGSSWSNASGNIQDMINKALPGDEVWIAAGTYEPLKEYEWDNSQSRAFKLKMGVSLYGGFYGVETSLLQRKKIDRDKNGKIDPWEYQYETILSGDGDKQDIWTQDDTNRILEVKRFEDNSETVVRLNSKDFDNESLQEYPPFYFSSITITGGKYGVEVTCSLLNNFSVLECTSYFNEVAIHNLYTLLFSTERSNIHHNINAGISGGKSYMNYIHHNLYKGVEGDFVENCTIYHNGKNGISWDVYGGGVSADTIKNCLIYENRGCYGGGGYEGVYYDCIIHDNLAFSDGGGIYNANAYNCQIYNNQSYKDGGGAYQSILEDCTIYNNKSQGKAGGASGKLTDCIIYNNKSVDDGGGALGTLINCAVYNNESLLNGGGISEGTAYSCHIFGNKADENGGGAANAHLYNCNIYNNTASSYGGIYNDYHNTINCTIANNKSFSGNDNKGNLCNTIVVGTFEGEASYSTLTDSYISGEGNFLVTEKELKFIKTTTFIGCAINEKQLKELKNANFQLSQGSIAIDMGKQIFNEFLPVEDKSGYPRLMGEKTDIGAHEYLSIRALPYENTFSKNDLSMNIGSWKNDKLSGKDGYFLYYDGLFSPFDVDYVTSPFFDKTASNNINLSFDIATKFKTNDQQEKLYIVLAYLDSDKRDTIMSYSNRDYNQELHFSKEISSKVKNKVFRVLFAVEDSKKDDYYNNSNIIYCGISNLKITKQDASVEIIAKDQVYMYNGKSHMIDFQINDTRVDKNKVVVTYLKEGETKATTIPPVNAGTYQVDISIEDGFYFGMKSVKLSIEKANQFIQWPQQLRTIKAKERIKLEATATSDLPVEFLSENETIAKIEKNNNQWWLVADTLPGEVTIKAIQLGNENYNLANSVLKTIQVEAIPTNIELISTVQTTVCFVKSENKIYIKGTDPKSKLYLYDSSGRLCHLIEAKYADIHIPVNGLNKGVYYLLIINKDKRENFKVLIY